MPVGATIVSGAGTACITVNFSSAYKSGSICVRAVNACDSSASKCLSIPKLTEKPKTPRRAVGPNTLCAGTCGVYTIPPVAKATSYLWTTTGGLTIQSGQGTTTVTVCAPVGFTSGELRVRAVNCKGQSSERKMSIKVKKLPGQPGSISGPSTVCVGSTTYKYTSGSSSDATSYSWTVTGVTNNIVSTSGKDIFVQFLSSGTATLTVRGVNFCGQSVTPRTKTVNVVICPRFADGSSVTEVKAYPNPVKDLLNVSFISDMQQSYVVKLMDMTGRVMYNEDRTAAEGENTMEINVSGMSSGIYMLNFQMGDSNEQIRVVVE